MFKKFIEWTEGDKARGRKVVLFSTITTFLLITVGLFTSAMLGVVISDAVVTLYITLVGLLSVVYGFYTGTSSDKSEAVANKAADIMLEKMRDVK